MARIFVLLICCLPGILSQCSVDRAQPFLKRYVYEFSMELSSRIAEEKENHFIASTFSPWTILSTAALGAEGETLEELRTVLRLHRKTCFNKRYFDIIRSVSTDGTGVTLERSANIFVDEKSGVTEVFRKSVQEAGISNIDTFRFDNPENVAAIINNYVSQATHNTISDIVVPSDLENVNLVMVDAVYFKGMWQIPFSYEDTEIKPFYNELGVHTGDVNLMFLSGMFNMSVVRQIDARVLELPYGNDGRFAMLVFLPIQNSLSAMIDSLKRISLTTIYTIFAEDFMQSVNVEIPRFKIASDLSNLKDWLMDMGVRKAFDSQDAEFPYLSDYDLYISNFVQKANIEVNEEGSIASGATEAGFASRSGPERFRANKPFFYMIIDKQTEVVLFTGAYSKPSLY